MDDLYRDFILDHYRRPRNYGHLERPDIVRDEDNPLCGDHIRLELNVDDGVVSDVRFSGQGCAISQASASVLTEMVKGQSLAELRALDKDDVLGELGIETIAPARLKCATLSLRALRAGALGLSDWPDEEEEAAASGGEGEEEEWPPR